MRFHALLALLLLSLLLPLRAQAAVNCTATPSTMDFGTINTSPIPQTNVAPNNLSIHCTGVSAGTQIGICLGINAGTGTGSTGTTNPTRYMNSGANQVQYQIYSDAAYSNIWGSGEEEIFITPASNGNITQTVPMYGQILNPPAQTKPAGTYTSNVTVLNGSSTDFIPGFGCGWVDAIGRPVSGGTFLATVTLNNTCSITANNINFGTLTSLATLQNMSGSLGVTCNSAAPYTIAMNAGSTTGNTIAARKMSLNGAGAGVVKYQLYRDGYGTTLWGDGTAGSSTYVGSGTGSLQAIPVYAQMPAQATPAVGTYKDTVTATITY